MCLLFFKSNVKNIYYFIIIWYNNYAMKTSILRISNEIMLGKKQDEISQYLLKNCLEVGEIISCVNICENHPDHITKQIENSDADFLIVVGENISSRNFNIKKTIANITGTNIVKNNFAENTVRAYYQESNIPVLFDSENEFYLPENAELLPIKISALQSFILKTEQKTFLFIPGELDIAKFVFENYLKNIIKQNIVTKYKTTTIKTFGISEKDIYSILSDLIKNKYKILFLTYPNNLEVSIVIRYNENIDPEIINDVIYKVYERLNKYIYAEEEVTIAKRALDLLKIGNKKLAIAETITGGNISTSLIKQCDNCQQNLVESIVASNQTSLINRLKVSPSILNQYGEVSVEVAYEMAAGLLETSNADIVLTTSGKIDYEDNSKVGKICFIAVGNVDGIHVYKNTLYGTREQVIESLTQTAFYYLIKNIKQNDLFFDKTTV